MKFSLIVLTGTTAGKEIPIRLPEFTVGRDPGCHLRPASPMISKKHCSFILQGEQVLFKDFGSTNGSFVNDQKVEGETYLRDGDVVKFGPLVFKVKLQATAIMAAAPTVVPAADKTVVENAANQVIASSVQKAKKASTSEDDIAAMLFNFADAPSGSIPSDSIPMGSTVAGLSLDPSTKEDQPALTEEQRKTNERKKADAAKSAANSANTSTAAQAILEKYMRRPR
jgi:pSer/pThr/pTyr-binding forkhead associated (FHA) protein